MNAKIDEYLSKQLKWKEELVLLRKLVLECGVTEELKWGVPCYTFESNNIVMLGAFKEYCVLSFVKGALLRDEKKILIQQTENSHSVRIVRFTSLNEIHAIEITLKNYIHEAIQHVQLGTKIASKQFTEQEYVEELINKLNENPTFKAAFEALTPGRRRAYNLYFSAAKQSQTRALRIENYIPKILSGKGINDCTCGMSKKMPVCDGSHKYLKTS